MKIIGIDTILIDEPQSYQRAKEFLELVMPRYSNRLQLYEGKEPLFHKYGLEDEISKMYHKRIEMPLSPGSPESCTPSPSATAS